MIKLYKSWQRFPMSEWRWLKFSLSAKWRAPLRGCAR
jgi:hypothetical protein